MCGTLGSRSQGSRPVTSCQSCWHCPLTPWLLQLVMIILMSWCETHGNFSQWLGSLLYVITNPWDHDTCANDSVLSVVYTTLAGSNLKLHFTMLKPEYYLKLFHTMLVQNPFEVALFASPCFRILPLNSKAMDCVTLPGADNTIHGHIVHDTWCLRLFLSLRTICHTISVFLQHMDHGGMTTHHPPLGSTTVDHSMHHHGHHDSNNSVGTDHKHGDDTMAHGSGHSMMQVWVWGMQAEHCKSPFSSVAIKFQGLFS